MVSLKSGLVNSQGCLEDDIGVCLSSSDNNSGPDVELSSQSFGDVLGSFPSPILGPIGLAHDGDGNLYLTDIFPGMVHLIDVFGAPIASFFYLPNTGSAVDVTIDGTHIYLADSSGREVDIYTLAGMYVSSFSVGAQTDFPGAITFNPVSGNLYVVDADFDGGDHVFEYTTMGTLVNTFPLASISTDGIAFDPVRCTYWVYDSPTDTITHYDPSFKVILQTFPGSRAAGFADGEGVAVIGDVLYMAASASNRILSFDLTGADTSFANTCNISTAIDLTVQKSNNINGMGEVGIPFNWTINLTNMGLTDATFDPGEVLLEDDLPLGPTYGTPSSGNFSEVNCIIESDILTCTASGGAVTISSNGGFDVVFSVTPTAPGTLDNPTQGGICRVDPHNTQAETDESNNNCTDSVIIEEKPTAIDLVSFKVEANAGQAIITWETATEIDNAGFNIHRATSPDGPWVQVNSALIAAEGDPVSGAHYTFIDTPGRGAFYYRLEDIDFFGISILHQSVLVEMGAAIRLPWYRPSLPEFE